MTTERLISRTSWCLSLILGQASVLLGLMLMLGWLFALALIVPARGVGWASRPGFVLPIEPSLLGLGAGALALWMARRGWRFVSRFAIAGVVLNTMPLVLALILTVLRMGH